VIVAGAAVLGALLTIVTGSDPGFLLGLMVVVGTVGASFAVSARRAYLIIPAPALAYLVAAMLAGLIHDRAADSSRTLLAINAGRWIASGFLAMTAATALAVAIAVVRYLRSGRGLGFWQLKTRRVIPRRGQRRW
jgi:hypothetical protein